MKTRIAQASVAIACVYVNGMAFTTNADPYDPYSPNPHGPLRDQPWRVLHTAVQPSAKQSAVHRLRNLLLLRHWLRNRLQRA